MPRVRLTLLFFLILAIIASALLIFYLDQKNNSTTKTPSTNAVDDEIFFVDEQLGDSFNLEATLNKVTKKGETVEINVGINKSNKKEKFNVTVYNEPVSRTFTLATSTNRDNLYGEETKTFRLSKPDEIYEKLNKLKGHYIELLFRLKSSSINSDTLRCNQLLLDSISDNTSLPECSPHSNQIAAYEN